MCCGGRSYLSDGLILRKLASVSMQVDLAEVLGPSPPLPKQLQLVLERDLRLASER